jgi:hypothetical protein
LLIDGCSMLQQSVFSEIFNVQQVGVGFVKIFLGDTNTIFNRDLYTITGFTTQNITTNYTRNYLQFTKCTRFSDYAIDTA